jgi:hypothetical protein
MSSTSVIELTESQPRLETDSAKLVDEPLTITGQAQGNAFVDDLITSKSRTAAIITTVACVTGISALVNGIVTVALPIIAQDLQLSSGLMLW